MKIIFNIVVFYSYFYFKTLLRSVIVIDERLSNSPGFFLMVIGLVKLYHPGFFPYPLRWISNESSCVFFVCKKFRTLPQANIETTKQATSVVTAQIFSILYYACCVWLTPVLSKKCLKTIVGLHYRSLRLILRDYRQRVSRELITIKTKRLPPDKWAKFSLASLFLNIYNQKQPATLLAQFTKNFYEKRRKPGFSYAYDSSRTKIGKQSTRNWIGSAIGGIKSPWNNQTLSKDSIRVLMKKTYY